MINILAIAFSSFAAGISFTQSYWFLCGINLIFAALNAYLVAKNSK